MTRFARERSHFCRFYPFHYGDDAINFNRIEPFQSCVYDVKQAMSKELTLTSHGPIEEMLLLGDAY